MNVEFSSLIKNPEYHGFEAAVSRFSGASWFQFVCSQRLLVAGVGGIGSWLAFMLSRLSPREIILVDDDQFSVENMAGQLCSSDDLGANKVAAVSNMIRRYSSFYSIDSYCDRVASSTRLPNIVFTGFDNMEARRATYIAWKRSMEARYLPQECLLIDGRLSAETLQIFCLTGDVPAYLKDYEENWLFTDDEADSTVCSYKQTSYCANLIASLMTNLFVNWCTNKCNPIIDRALPFMTEYSAEQMYLKTKV